MYRRIMGFFGGVTAESSEDSNQKLTVGRNEEVGELAETLDKTDCVSAREQKTLRDRIISLEQELKVRTEECENYKNRLELAEKKLRILQTTAVPPPTSKVSTGVGDGAVDASKENTNENELSLNTGIPNMEKLTDENNELRVALTKAGELLKDKTDLCDNQEKKNNALTSQIESLKEVVAITKDLLNIRNMEVQHLQNDVELMEGKISDERQRHNLMITQMDEAVKLNSDLKAEYENQLGIFQELKIKYEEKVKLLTKENEKLEEEVSLSKTVQNTLQNNQELTTNNSVIEETGTQ